MVLQVETQEEVEDAIKVVNAVAAGVYLTVVRTGTEEELQGIAGELKANDLVQIRSIPGTGRAKGYMRPVWRNVLIRRFDVNAPKYIRVVKKQTAPVEVEDDTVLDVYSLNLYWNDHVQL